MPMAPQKFLEVCGSRKTGTNSKTSTATKLDHGELASLLAECPRTEESRRARAIHDRPAVPKQEDDGELEHVVVVGWEGIHVAVGMSSPFPSAPKCAQLFVEVFTTTESSRQQRKALQRHGVRNTA